MSCRVAQDASSLYAKNLFNFISPHFQETTGNLTISWEDETIIGTLITKEGEVMQESLRDVIKVPNPKRSNKTKRKSA